MREYKLIFAIIVLCLLSAGRAGAGGFVPWDYGHPAAAGPAAAPAPVLSLPAELLYRGSAFFSHYISPVDGDRCAMYPTCSAYSRQAVAKHGFILGWIMTADRLIHENNEVDTAPLVRIGTAFRYHDPVEHNDFWWDRRH